MEGITTAAVIITVIEITELLPLLMQICNQLFRHLLSLQNLRHHRSNHSVGRLTYFTAIWLLEKGRMDKSVSRHVEKPKVIPHLDAPANGRSSLVSASCFEMIQNTFPSFRKKSMYFVNFEVMAM